MISIQSEYSNNDFYNFYVLGIVAEAESYMENMETISKFLIKAYTIYWLKKAYYIMLIISFHKEKIPKLV